MTQNQENPYLTQIEESVLFLKNQFHPPQKSGSSKVPG